MSFTLAAPGGAAPMMAGPAHVPKEEVKKQDWSPYDNNGGTVIAVAGKDYAIVAGDTRLSDGGYGILTREAPKLCELTKSCVIGTSGMQSDMATLQKMLKMRLTMYKHKHHKDLSCPAVAQMLSNTLYYKRFFPYYTFNLVVGLDLNGEGVVYGYDAIGSFEKMPYGAVGTGSALTTSILDNQVAFKTQMKNKKDLSVSEALDLVKDVMTSAGERDIYTGDGVDIAIITKDGVRWERFELKKD